MNTKIQRPNLLGTESMLTWYECPDRRIKFCPTHERILHCDLVVLQLWLSTLSVVRQCSTQAGLRRMHRHQYKEWPTDQMVCELCRNPCWSGKEDILKLELTQSIRRHHCSLRKVYFPFSIQGYCDTPQCKGQRGIVQAHEPHPSL